MAIENRDLTPGTVLRARYKQQPFTCTVEENDDHALAFVLPDGTRYKSPSAAGSAIMGGIACNGWRFWSLASTAEAGEPPAATSADAKRPRGGKLLKRVPNQQGVPEGQVRYFCSGCMSGFTAPAGEPPAACPQGHSDTPAA